MFFLEFGRWWYGAGWAHVLTSTRQRIRSVALAFSLPILLRTLFQPWKRIISYGNHSLQDSMRAMLDNAVSRFVGLGVRVVVIIAALILIAFTSIIGVIAILAWPLLPIAGIALIIRGFLPW